MEDNNRILQGMAIQVGRGRYIVPITTIRQSLKTANENLIVDPNGNEMIKIQEEIYNLERLYEFFAVETKVTDIDDGIVMLLENGDERLCIFADKIIGEMDVSVKPLPGFLPDIEGVGGCAILDDEELCLILEVSDFFSGGGERLVSRDDTDGSVEWQDPIADNAEIKDKYFTFEIEGEEYGIEVANTKEIIGVRKITEVPSTASYIEGIISLRGDVVPVINVRKRFHKPHREYDANTCVIVVNYRKYTIGLIVDRVKEVIYIGKEDISPPPSAKLNYYNQYISNMGKAGDSVKQLVDLEKFLFS